MKSKPKTWPAFLSASFLITTLILTVSPGSAQPMSLDTPADSPLWWTLTPDLSPTELRARYRDPAETLNRYQAAVAEGLAEPLSEQQTSKLRFYQNFDLEPELTPMWLALNMFAAPMERIGAEEIKKKLAPFEISPEGQELIVSALRQLSSDEKALVEEVGPKQVEFQKIFIRAEKEGHSEAFLDWAFTSDDADVIASMSSHSKAEIEDLLAAMKVSPPSIASATALEKLKAGLTPEDWDGMRRYLLVVEAQSMDGAFTDFS